MRYLIFISIFMLFKTSLFSQTNEEVYNEIKDYQTNLNDTFTNPETSILLPVDFEKFNGLEFYPINLDFRVESKLIRTPDEKPFLMLTTTERLPLYVKYATLEFSIGEREFVLDLFQNLEPKEGYENSLFLPFTDLTSGDGSYGGGRYLDLLIPEGDTIIIDFNKAYNPYCTYNPRYSCPIPPEQNDLKIRIEAGVKDFLK